MTSSTVTKPKSFSFSNNGICLMPLSIINLASLLIESFFPIFGAETKSVLTFVVAGSSLDRRIDRRVIRPSYLPFSLSTANTGGKPFLKPSKHLERVSVS